MRISSLFFLFCCLSFFGRLQAQEDILESLKSKKSGEGVVTIHQDSRLSELVGSKPNTSTTTTTVSSGIPANIGSGGENIGRRSFRTTGYRLQVYAGNNSNQSKEEARKKAAQVNEYLPGVAVYTYFLSPRWVCRVGDFRSIEEADAAMRKLKATPYFKEIIMVREQVNVHY